MRLRRITLRTGTATPSCSNHRLRRFRNRLTPHQVPESDRLLIGPVRVRCRSGACCGGVPPRGMARAVHGCVRSFDRNPGASQTLTDITHFGPPPGPGPATWMSAADRSPHPTRPPGTSTGPGAHMSRPRPARSRRVRGLVPAPGHARCPAWLRVRSRAVPGHGGHMVTRCARRRAVPGCTGFLTRCTRPAARCARPSGRARPRKPACVGDRCVSGSPCVSGRRCVPADPVCGYRRGPSAGAGSGLPPGPGHPGYRRGPSARVPGCRQVPATGAPSRLPSGALPTRPASSPARPRGRPSTRVRRSRYRRRRWRAMAAAVPPATAPTPAAAGMPTFAALRPVR